MIAQQYKAVSYDAKVWLLLITLIVGLALTTFQLKQNFNANNLIILSENTKRIYLYEPPYLKSTFEILEIDYEAYKKRDKQFLISTEKMGLEITPITSLGDLKKESTLIFFDAIALSQNDKVKIEQHLTDGGALLFNSSAGFRDEFAKYQGDAFVHKITGLSLSAEYGYLTFPEGLMATPKLLSPLTTGLKNGPLLEIITYDPLPMFTMPKGRTADVYMTNHPQAAYPKVGDKQLNKSLSGLVWSGTYGKGKWAYTSLPLYSLYESLQSKKELLSLYQGMINYLDQDVVVRAYPYLDAKSVSFVSEDTEYRYESVGQFAKLSLDYKVPTTIFCVAELAHENKELMNEVIQNPYLEVGSHSYTHKAIVGTDPKNYLNESQGSKKLLEKLTGRKISGFRPPREEIDTLLMTNLKEGGFDYILNLNEARLYPYFQNNIMIIPRHGTDDYSYLVNLDWTPQEIADNMIKESKFYQDLNGIYTMSTHTHLMNFSTNISILEQYYRYITNAQDMVSMNGEMIYARIKALQNIRISSETDSTTKHTNIKVTNQNDAEVKNYTFRLYSMPKTISEVTALDPKVQTRLKKVQEGVYDVTISAMQPDTQTLLVAK